MTINPIIVQIVGGGGLTYEVNSGTAYPSNVTSIDLPPNATKIGDYAFYGCSSLASVAIPAGVTSIGNSTFYGCSSLKSITLPNGLKTIGSSAIRSCTSLASITIPASVTSLDTYALADCTSLRELTSLATTPPALTNTSLSAVPANCVIRVPAGSVAAYKAAANWSARAAYITAI